MARRKFHWVNSIFPSCVTQGIKPFLDRRQLCATTFDIGGGYLQLVERFYRFDLRTFKGRHGAIETTTRLFDYLLKIALCSTQTARCHALTIKLGDRAVDRLYKLLRVHQHLAPLGKRGFFSWLGR